MLGVPSSLPGLGFSEVVVAAVAWRRSIRRRGGQWVRESGPTVGGLTPEKVAGRRIACRGGGNAPLRPSPRASFTLPWPNNPAAAIGPNLPLAPNKWDRNRPSRKDEV